MSAIVVNQQENSVALPETLELEALAANNAQIAIDFLRAGNRGAAREHLKRAIQQLNEAEIEG